MRRRGRGTPVLLVAVSLLFLSRSPAWAEPTRTIRVELVLRTGAHLTGAVVDYDENALVVVRDETPYVFAWSELVPGSAYATRRALVRFERGKETLTAGDHFLLGRFALSVGRSDLAALDFRKAQRMDPALTDPIRAAWDAFRRRKRIRKERRRRLLETETAPASSGSADARDEGTASRDAAPRSGRPMSPASEAHPTVPQAETAEPVGSDLSPAVDESSPGRSAPPLADSLMAKQRTAVADVYRRFGEKVREVLGKRITLVESPHFLIWTDWSARDRGRLPDWCEAMYAALCRQFGIDPTEPVFPAGCPLFCFESEKRFRRFAREFDGYGGLDAVGYTRSIPENGHVHVVLLRKGRTPEDFDRFACTLVHEGTHAFLHRLFTTRLIPHWVNEGIAEMMTERVLGDRCPAGEKADLLARQYARYDWPVGDWVRRAGPIEVHEYPLACSLVTFLEGQGTERFRAFVRDLKNGESLEAALARRYDGWSMETFLRRWREHVRRDGSPAKP